MLADSIVLDIWQGTAGFVIMTPWINEFKSDMPDAFSILPSEMDGNTSHVPMHLE